MIVYWPFQQVFKGSGTDGDSEAAQGRIWRRHKRVHVKRGISANFFTIHVHHFSTTHVALLPFTSFQSNNFRDIEDLDHFLTSGERQAIINHLLNSLRAETDDEVEGINFREGEAISKILRLGTLETFKLILHHSRSSHRRESWRGKSGVSASRSRSPSRSEEKMGRKVFQKTTDGWEKLLIV